MDERWGGTGPATGPADAPGYGYGPAPGYGPPGFGPPVPYAPPRPDGRASRRHLAAYVTTGVLLIVFACVLGAWIADTAIKVNVDLDGLLDSLVKNDVTRPLLVFSAHEWAFAVALTVVGIAAVALRRTARGAALLLAFLLLGVALRQLGGLLRSDYRDVMFDTEHGTLIVLTYVFALLSAVTVIVLMLVVRERDGQPGAEPEPGSEPTTVGRRAAGVLLILIGAVQGFWYAYNLRQFDEAVAPGGGRGAFAEWWHELLNINARGGYATSAGYTYYHSALIAAFLVVGVLMLRRAPAAKGAALTLLGITAYIQIRHLAGIQYDRLTDYYQDSTVGWNLTSSFAVAAAMIVAVALIRHTPRPYVPPQYPTAPMP